MAQSITTGSNRSRRSLGRAKARPLTNVIHHTGNSMSRTQGAGNIQPFEARAAVATTSAQDVRHLARQSDLSPLDQFEALLRNQRTFLNWIDTRHSELVDAKKQINPNGRGPKDGVYRKYRWYTEQQSLLEAINGFEVFYKSSSIALAKSVRRYVAPQKIKGNVDAKVLWVAQGSASFTSLIFEHQLFHNLDAVDDATNMLIGAKRYIPSNLNGPLAGRVRAIQCIFQIRHTLSHNQGRVTQSDSAKFASLGFAAEHGEVIDPGKDHLGDAVRDLLKLEAREFTAWALSKTAIFLSGAGQRHPLTQKTKNRIEKLVGKHPDLDALAWQ